MIGRDNQSRENWLNNKVMVYLSQTKSHPYGGDFVLSALFKGDTTDSSCQQQMEITSLFPLFLEYLIFLSFSDKPEKE